MSETATLVVCARLIIIGVIGIVVPVLPGLLLVLLAVLVWAISTGGGIAWTVFAVAAAVYATGVAAQFLLPGRRLKAQGVGMGTLMLAVLGGIVGFFVIPVVGAFAGFVLAIFLVELSRSRSREHAWTRTKAALRAIVHSMGIELMTAFAITVILVVGVVITKV